MKRFSGEATRLIGCALLLGVWACDDGGQVITDDSGTDGGVADVSAVDQSVSDGPVDGGPADGAGGDAALEPDVFLTPRERLEAVEETESWAIPGLSAPAFVVRTEMNIPHVYAENRSDLGRVLGFTVARDRFFVMDLQRRLGLGTLTELLGDAVLANDIEARGTGITFVSDRLLENLSPGMQVYLDAFADGINDYIAAVDRGDLPPPSELVLAKALLGAPSEVSLMKPWDRRSVVSMVAVIMYQTNYETGDVGRQRSAQALEEIYADEATFQGELRKAGFRTDAWDNVSPLFPRAISAAGLGVETEAGLQAGPGPMARARGRASDIERRRVPMAMLQRLETKLDKLQLRLKRDKWTGFGSNAWAVAGSATSDGSMLVAGDGHLQLSVPPLMYQIGMDTELLGQGGQRQAGLLLTGLPLLAVGTNGKVAWSQTNPVMDITDWYREELQVEDGVPTASMFQGEWRPLERIEETYEVAEIMLLDSVGRTETVPRWRTFDGRFLTSIEGRPPEEGEASINLLGDEIVPEDIDGDGVITGISFDYAAFDAAQWIDALDQFGQSEDVAEFQEATRKMIGAALLTAGGDSKGDILFSSYQSVPCRGYLPKDENGWMAGADPTQLIDGTQYGAFSIPTTDGVYAGDGGDPYACAIPFESVPQAVSPAKGFVYTANNDVGALTIDGRIDNDEWYIGGPWASARGDTIHRDLEAAIAEGTADVAEMSRIQGNHQSRLGQVFAPHLIAAIAAGRDAQNIDESTPELERLAALYSANSTAFDEVEQRLTAWGESGWQAESGVETFYYAATDENRAQAVATMIFNAWFGRALRATFDDEGVGGAWRFSTSHTQTRLFRHMLESRGENMHGQASFFAETGESIFFDVLGTEAVERSEEILLSALAEGLEFLASEQTGPGEGGFGTDDMDQWLWGLRHMTLFNSLLADFLGDDPTFGAILGQFAITPRKVPLSPDGIPRDDPRSGLTGFPRPGDQWNVDAANPGFSGTRFTHKNGPVMRMAIALKDGEVSGVNIVPGGQSALTNSDNFADQVRLWLANETVPIRFSPSQVADGAVAREVFLPE